MTRSTSAQDTLALIGRVLIAWLFIPSGYGKFAGFSGVAGYIASKGIPFPEVCAALAIAAGPAAAGGLAARWAALGLAIFPAVITSIFHNLLGRA